MKIEKDPLECFQEDTEFINKENTVDTFTEVKTEKDVFEIPLLKPYLTFKIKEEFQKETSHNENDKYFFSDTQNSEYFADLNNINDHKVKSEFCLSPTDLNVIKQENNELKYTLPKDELLNKLNTDYCDLPTLKSDVDYLEESCSGQQYQAKKVNRYPCAVDKKSYLIPQKRLGHIEKHFWKRWIACELCGHFYTDRFGYFTHLFIHSVKKSRCSFKCKICSKQFTQKQNLNEHLKIHTGEKIFKYEVCSKQFTRKQHFNKHSKNYTGVKTNTCEVCLKQFSQKSNLNKHLKIHTGEKPFGCEVCLKQFRQKSDLHKHLRIHTGEKPFKCEICLKQFRIKENLKRHLNIHKDQKLFKCELCSKQFTQNPSLKRHLKNHTYEKLFKCIICLKQFTRNQNLKRHLKIHTRGHSSIT